MGGPEQRIPCSTTTRPGRRQCRSIDCFAMHDAEDKYLRAVGKMAPNKLQSIRSFRLLSSSGEGRRAAPELTVVDNDRSGSSPTPNPPLSVDHHPARDRHTNISVPPIHRLMYRSAVAPVKVVRTTGTIRSSGKCIGGCFLFR